MKGSGNQYDYGFRIYDPRIGKFLSVDPIAKDFPWYTPYQFAGNKPIVAVDLDGKEEFIYYYEYNNGEPILIDKANNIEWRVDEANSSVNGIAYKPYNKSTGEPFRDEEYGQAQYQYFDNGNRVNQRRNVQGDFVNGPNELMEDWTKNHDGSVYIGGNNPKLNGVYDYRREPQDEADAIAKEHDQDFDKATPGGLKGLPGTMNKISTPANEKAIKSATNLLYKKTDKVTGEKVTDATRARAKSIVKLFKTAETLKKENYKKVERFGE